MRGYWKTFLFLIVSALVYKYLNHWLPSGFNWFMTLLWCAILVGLGLTMSLTAKRNHRWLGKTILALIIMIVVIYKLNLINVDGFTRILSMVGLDGFFLDLLLVVCGWAFFLV